MDKSIVIDREYGSGGREIAKILSARLGIEFYDGNLLEIAGEKCGVSLSTMKDYDEKGTGSFLHDLVLFSDAFSGGNEYNKAFEAFDALTRVIQGLAAQQPCIFLGRCADEILKDQVPFLHVFVYADKIEDKIKRVVEIDGIAEGKAVSYMNKKDMQRMNFRKKFSKKPWNSMQSYDLCINTSAVDYGTAADVILAAVK